MLPNGSEWWRRHALDISLCHRTIKANAPEWLSVWPDWSNELRGTLGAGNAVFKKQEQGAV
jgi:hypothetical protein